MQSFQNILVQTEESEIGVLWVFVYIMTGEHSLWIYLILSSTN